MSDKNDYIKFGHTNLESDGGQTAIPLWDAQDVTSLPVLPLTSAGFLYKTYDNNGGYVTLVIGTYEYSGSLKSKYKIDELEENDFDIVYKHTW